MDLSLPADAESIVGISESVVSVGIFDLLSKAL